MHRSQIWEQPEKEPISDFLSVFKFLTLGTDSFNKTCYLTLQLAYTGCHPKENSISKEVKSSRNNLTAAIPGPWSFTPFAEVLLLTKQIKHRNPGDELLWKPKSCSANALNIALQLPGSVWSMDWRWIWFFWCVLQFSTEVPRTVASCWSHAAHRQGLSAWPAVHTALWMARTWKLAAWE